MNFTNELIEATILKRYKRFLSDIKLSSGEIINAHVPNTGRMDTCWEPGWKVYLSHHDNPKRKMKYTLELTSNGDTLIGVNTAFTNKIALEALENKLIPELANFDQVYPERKVLDSRIDFYLESTSTNETAFVEVKNATLVKDKQVLFPDAVSVRGQKHIRDLIELKSQGHRAAMLYVVNREDALSFSTADEIDPIYGKLLKEAQSLGVEIYAYSCKITPQEITLTRKLEVKL